MTQVTDRRHTNRRTGEVVDDPTVRPFADWLREQGEGKTHDELSEALYDLVARVTDTGRKGTLTLTITVEPMKKSDEVLVISDEIKLKLPEFDRPVSVFYTDDQGNLIRNNPNQPELAGLRDVSAPGAPDPNSLKDAR